MSSVLELDLDGLLDDITEGGVENTEVTNDWELDQLLQVHGHFAWAQGIHVTVPLGRILTKSC
jgi:hypothetical protein